MTAIQGDTELKHSHRAMWASGDYPRMVTTFPTPLGGTDGRTGAIRCRKRAGGPAPAADAGRGGRSR